MPFEVGHVEGVQNATGESECDASGRRGWHGQNGVSAVGKPYRLSPNGSVRGQVAQADEAAAALHLGDDQLGRLASVEPVRPRVAGALERPGQVSLSRGVADAGGSTPGEEHVRGGWKPAEPCDDVRLEGPNEAVPDLEAPCQRDSRVDQLAPGEPAEAEMGLPHAPHRSGDPSGEMPDHRAFIEVATGVEEHVSRGTSRSAGPVVQCLDGPIRRAEQHEAATRHVARLRVHDGQGEGDGHRRVDGVPAAIEHGKTDLAGVPIGGDDHGVGRYGRR
jgi:hypothetical protein